MTFKNCKPTILTAFVVALFIGSTNGQAIPRSIEINASHSLESTQTLDMKAYQTIAIREGFKMVPGSSLKLMVVQKDINSTEDRDAELLVVYPNPSPGIITIQGVFNNDDLIVYDHAGNLSTQFTINGENPTVDLSRLKNERYIIKAPKSNKTARVIKN
ncbi:hypothetical protein WSM22_39120 [Cytophagales bacterium WSM2-2]|nr:hypothetical protein WSM22_39120 [Cytophagales bacterium WSM2-2]